ncbi:HPP family protein [Aureimonas glaciei]|uniref:HPP family protein n=1 Tax=Aureimonas glaciei TaxID=1776957 RepID=UPI0016695CE0|nr:HPP family protein [Aureimonas glaciei]
MLAFFSHLVPSLSPVSVRERLRSALGAGLGILVTGLVSRLALGEDSGLPLLIAPMGASAVLLFAVPASPLAQPWSIVGGNTIAALVGVSATLAIPDPFLAGAVAVALSIALMMTLRCVHPPSGAVALTAVLGGPAIHALGFGFVLWPVGVNSLLLLATALAFNNASGRSYPHVPAARPVDRHTADPAPSARVGFSPADLDAALAEFDQLLDVDRGDLEAILRQAEMRGYQRRAGDTTCGAIMSRDVVAISPDAPLREAFDLMRHHHIRAIPVTDDNARILGIVTQSDLLQKAVWGAGGPRLALRHRLRLTATHGRAPRASIGDIMTTPVIQVGSQTPIADLVPVMTDAGLHHLPVVDDNGKMVGIVSQTDLIAALLADRVAGRSAAG